MNAFKTLLVIGLGACATAPYGGKPYFPAVTPTEVVEAVPASARGTVGKDGVLPVGTIRARHAARLSQSAGGVPADVQLFGAVLRGAPDTSALPDDAAMVAWCDSREPGTFGRGAITCFRDKDGDGAFDESMYAMATLGAHALAWSPIIVRGDMVAPVAYERVARDEVETRQIGYRRCQRGRRFASVVMRHDGKWPSANGCNFGREAQDGTYRIDAVTVRIGADDENALSYEIIDPLPQDALYVEKIGAPFQVADAAKTKAERVVDGLKSIMAQPGLVADGALTIGSVGDVFSKGDVLVSIPVRHGTTGRVRNRIKPRGLLTFGKAIEPGDPVFAVGLLSAADLLSERADVTWCAPRRDAAAGPEAKWNTVCLPKSRWVQTSQELYPTQISYAQNGTSYAAVPDVEREEVDIDMGLTLSVSLARWREDEARFDFKLEAANGQEQGLRRATLPVVEGRAVLTLGPLQRVLVFEEDEEGRARLAEVRGTVPITPGTPAY